MRKLFLTFLLLISTIAHSASLLPNGKQQFIDGNGRPLAGGKVYFYIPSTLTPKTTWKDSLQTQVNTNPVVLDSSGFAVIYGSGAYREIVQDRTGVTVWDQLTADFSSSGPSWLGLTTGSANAQIASTGSFAAVDGQIISFQAGYTNTGPTSITINGLLYNFVIDTSAGPVSLSGGEITASGVSTAVYAGGVLHLTDPGQANSINITGPITTSGNITGSNITATTALTSNGTLNVTGTSTLATVNGTNGGFTGVLAATGTISSSSTIKGSGFTTLAGAPSAPWSTAGVNLVDGVPIKATNAVTARATVAASGALSTGFNIASVAKTGTGAYTVNFNNPIPSTGYQVSLTTAGGYGVFGSKSTTAVSIQLYNTSGAAVDSIFDIVINGGY